MPSHNSPEQESRRRKQHRVLGAYSALWAWCRGADAVALSRESLLAGFRATNLHRSRIDEFRIANEDFFPESELIHGVQRIEGLVISRRAIPKSGLWLGGSASRAAETLMEAGLTTIALALPTEEDAVAFLDEVSHGLAYFAEGIGLE